MEYGDNYWGIYRNYYRDPFPHSLLSTRQITSVYLIFRSLTTGVFLSMRKMKIMAGARDII